MIRSSQLVKLSAKKLVKKLIDLIDIIIAKLKIPNCLLEILLTSLSDISLE